MVQLFQRYVPTSSIVDFLVQSFLCLAAFTVAVQTAWWMHLDPALPTVAGVRFGRALTTVSVLVLVFYLTGYFDRRHHLNTSLFVPRLLQAVPLAALTLALLYQFVPTVALSWTVAGSGLLLMSVLMITWHVVAPALIDQDALGERILILGDGELACQIADSIDRAAPWGFRLVGYVPVGDGLPRPRRRRRSLRGPLSGGAPAVQAIAADDDGARVVEFPVPPRMNARALGRLADLEEILAEQDIHTLVVAIADRRGKLPLATLVHAKLRGVTVYDAVDFYERLTGRMMVARLHPSSIIFSDGFAPSRLTSLSKRLLDVALAIVALLFTAPLQALIALAVAATSPGPVLFRQERVGLNGLPFVMLKFRTMYTDAEKDGPRWAAADDDRVTPVGRLLRRSRLDELPQLWNILAGHMSFVGPRPERPVFVRQLRERIPYYHQRHIVRPGLTGWAQVKYPYGASVEEAQEKLEYDLYYIKRMSVAFDLTILFETVRVFLTGRGAR